MSPKRLFLLCLVFCAVTARRRVSQAQKAFEEGGGISWPKEEEEKESKKTNNKKSTETSSFTLKTTSTTTQSTTTEEETTTEAEDDLVARMLAGALDLTNLTKLVEQEHLKALEDATNRTILWVDANYKAVDLGINISSLQECRAWHQHWNITLEEDKNDTRKPFTEDEMKKFLKESEIVNTKKRLKKMGMKQELLEEYDGVGVMYSKICAGHSRVLWFNSTEDAKRLGIDEESPICGPFKEDLNPTPEVLQQLADKLNEIVEKGVPLKKKGKHQKVMETEPDVQKEEDQEILDYDFTKHGSVGPQGEPKQITENEDLLVPFNGGQKAEAPVRKSGDDVMKARTTQQFQTEEGITKEMWLWPAEERGSQSVEGKERPTGDHVPKKKPISPNKGNLRTSKVFKNEDGSETAHIVEETDDGSNLIDKAVSNEDLQKVDDEPEEYEDDVYDYKDFVKRYKVPKKNIREKRMAVENGVQEEEDDWVDPSATTTAPETVTEASEANKTFHGFVEVDVTDEINPLLMISSQSAISALGLDVPEDAFAKHEKVGFYLPGVCADYVPKAVDGFNSSSFEGVEIEGPIGVNISALEAAGVNLTELAEKLRNDTEVDDILSRTAGSVKTLGGSFILPVLNKNQYDPFSAPIVFRGSAVVVRFGIYIESMSNFQTTTMDYDMDIYLLMAWRDARLVNPYDKPILVKEEEILEKLWRPDPFFANAKQAEFHEVTFLNFLMRIFPDGLVLYETRVKITPSCNLILCKYPHDKQTCDLLIKSFAYPVETVRFEWFSNRDHAIDKNPHVKLPELYIDRYETTTCDKSRKSGTFSCLRAVFRLKRDVGFHLAQTYIPTSLALMFSWVGVWLPEEFMEGRIGVAITVLLTLSTESAGAREHLPSVSYLKAIDLWFGFITGFVFITLLQTLFVIGFDKKSSEIKKAALKKKSDISEEVREEMLSKAKKYHKIGRKMDVFCRVFYPLCFIIFLILYYFVYTEGRQDDCINRSASFE